MRHKLKQECQITSKYSSDYLCRYKIVTSTFWDTFQNNAVMNYAYICVWYSCISFIYGSISITRSKYLKLKLTDCSTKWLGSGPTMGVMYILHFCNVYLHKWKEPKVYAKSCVGSVGRATYLSPSTMFIFSALLGFLCHTSSLHSFSPAP